MAPSSAPGETASHVAGYWKRRFASLFRWLHIYLSMVSFGLLFFFAITGLTLNHADRFFQGEAARDVHRGQLPAAWLPAGDGSRIAKLEIAEHLRRTHGVKGLVSEFRIEDAQLSIGFKGPGYSADALVDRATGKYEVTELRMGFVAVINDLHKGRDTGSGWSLVVDISAVLMVLVSLTGMVLIYFVKRRFVSGSLMAIAGMAGGYLLYVWLVP